VTLPDQDQARPADPADPARSTQPRAPGRPWRIARRIARRLAALALGGAAALVLLELVLQVAALFAAPQARAALLPKAPGERRIVCLGDSNTYGVHLPASESYPAQLQALLDREPGQPWRVVNLGYPGQNSAQVRWHLADNIAAYEPDLLVVWIGINDCWSLALSHLWELPDREEPPGGLAGLLWKSRALKLARIGAAKLADRWELSVRGDVDRAEARSEVAGVAASGARGAGAGAAELWLPLRKARPTTDEMRARLALDLERIRAIAAERGVALAVCNYPYALPFLDEAINPTIEEFARRTGTPLVDLRARMLPLYERFGKDLLLFSDNHQTAPGNYEVARQVLLALGGADLIDERPAWAAVPPLEETLPSLSLARLEDASADGRVRIELLGNPGWSARLVLSALIAIPGEAAPRAPEVKNLVDTGLSEAEVARYRSLRIGANGACVTAILLPAATPTELLAARPGARFLGWRLVAESWLEGGRSTDHALSNALDVE
jgi:hypothetical protein